MPEPVTRVTSRRQGGVTDGSSLGKFAVMGAMGIVLAVALIGGVWLTARTLALLFAAIVIAEALAPLVDQLERRIPRGVAVATLYLGLGVLFGGLIWYFAPKLVEQAQDLTEQVPAAVERFQNVVEGWDLVGGTDIMSRITGNLGRFTDLLISVPMGLVTSVAQILLVVFMSAYWQLTRSGIARFLRSLAPRDHQEEVDGTLNALSQTVGGYVRGEIISALMVGLLVYAGLTIIGVKYSLVLAIVSAFGELIPVVGPIITAIPAILVAFFHSPTQGVIVLVFFLVMQQIESNIIIPNVMSEQADIPPLLVIAALSAGGSIGGILGALVAIPFAGALKVLVVQVVAPAIRRWTGADQAPTTVEEAQEETQEA